MKTLANKIVAVGLPLLTLPVMWLEGDGTATVMAILMFSVPLWVAKENVIGGKKNV